MKLETLLRLEADHYFFHPDHLGSSNYITNFAGEVSQHTEYIAFGETFIEEHKNSHNSPYKFNGKEHDEESGLYYYGARYYDPRISIWASVDPLVEQTMDAYGYCYQNPIAFIDPDGNNPTPGYYIYNWRGFYGNSNVGGEYIGNVKPNLDSYYELEKINGKLYHKNTNIWVVKIWNEVLGTDFVPKKEFSIEEEIRNDGIRAGFEIAATGILFKGIGIAWKSVMGNSKSLWILAAVGPGNRGVAYEMLLEKLGIIANRFKASNFKAYDAFSKGTAWSVKTIKLTDKSYTGENIKNIYYTLKGYIDDMINFTKDSKLGQKLDNSQITTRIMEVGIPKGATKEQIKQLERIVEYGKNNNIQVNIRVTN